MPNLPPRPSPIANAPVRTAKSQAETLVRSPLRPRWAMPGASNLPNVSSVSNALPFTDSPDDYDDALVMLSHSPRRIRLVVQISTRMAAFLLIMLVGLIAAIVLSDMLHSLAVIASAGR